jgi:hypothetical protein
MVNGLLLERIIQNNLSSIHGKKKIIRLYLYRNRILDYRETPSSDNKMVNTLKYFSLFLRKYIHWESTIYFYL